MPEPMQCPTCLTYEKATNSEYFVCGYSEKNENPCFHAHTIVEKLHKDAERNYRWAYRLLLALAKRHLREENDSRENPNDWPAGQAWDDLVGTSHSIFLRRARKEAGIEHSEFLKPLRAGEYSVEDLYTNRHKAMQTVFERSYGKQGQGE